MSDPAWNPKQYHAFGGHRARPAAELLSRIDLEAPRLAFDLGCGTGEVTRALAARWPKAEVHGVDASDEMLAEARHEPGRVVWSRADIASWAPEAPADLIFSNAALHWVAGHDALFPRLAGFLNPGGCLAVQMPLSHGLPSHRLMRETLADGGEGGAPLGSEELRTAIARKRVGATDVYYDLLAARARRLDVWETSYLHVLDGEDPVLEWVRGTGLRPVLQGLDDAERARFLDEYRRRLREAYPRRPDGRTLYPFRRLFLVAEV